MMEFMKRKQAFIVMSALSLASLAGCSHAHTRGSVVVQHSDTEADICIGSPEVKSGDRLDLYRVQCRENPGYGRGRPRQICEKAKYGEAEVLQTHGPEFSTVRSLGSTSIKSDTIVEKK